MTNHSKDLTESIWETRFSKPFKISSILASSLNFTTTKCLNPEVAINIHSFSFFTHLHTFASNYIEVKRFPCGHVHVWTRTCEWMYTCVCFCVMCVNNNAFSCARFRCTNFWHYPFFWCNPSDITYMTICLWNKPLCLVFICFFFKLVFDNLHVFVRLQFVFRTSRTNFFILSAFGPMSVLIH